jgi:signal peptidase I
MSEPSMRQEGTDMGRRAGGGLLGAGAIAVTVTVTVTVVVGIRRSLLRVQGPSMRPTLQPDDLVVTVPLPPAGPDDDGPAHGLGWWLRRRLVRPGRIVVLANPDAPSRRTVKRVTSVTPAGVDVVGDDPGWSIDSRVFGTVAHHDVRRLVVARIPARWSGTPARRRRTGRGER